MAMRLTHLVALFGLVAWALEDGLDDDRVTFVQMNVSRRAGVGAGHARNHEFRLEDAESLVDIAYKSAHDETKATIEEKAIALLQNLAQHRSVVGTGAQDALLKVASEAQRVVADASADEVNQESYEATTDAPNNGYDWVDITSDVDEGYAWHSLGGKPLQCQIKKEALDGKFLKDLYDLGTYADKQFSNPCEMLCARFGWCAGYGYKQTITVNQYSQRKSTEMCVLFNDGRGRCTGSDFLVRGILPVVSARDLVLKQGKEAETRTEDNQRVSLQLVEEDAGKYALRAKYRERPDAWYYNKDVDFKLVSRDTKCKHRLSKPGKDVYASEVEVLYTTFPFIDLTTYADAAGTAFRRWHNKCEKLCAMLAWCSGYAYKARQKDTMLPRMVRILPEECGLYVRLEDLPNSKDSWRGNTKQHAKGKFLRDPFTEAKIASQLVPDEEERDWMCKAKTYETKWRTNAGAGTNCKTGPIGVLMTTAMSIMSFLGAANCEKQLEAISRTSMNTSLLSSSASAALKAGEPEALDLMDQKKFGKLFAVNSSGASAYFTKGQAKTALQHLLKDTEGDARAIHALRSGMSQTTLCQVQYAGQGLRFLSYAMSVAVSTAYQCTLVHKDKYKCYSNSLRTLGGLFGSVMYGYPRLEQECGSNPWPVNTVSCVADFTKSTFYLGRAIWKFIQTTWIYGDDQDVEKWAGRVDMAASITFIAEGIIRSQGPCLGHFKGDEAATNLDNGGCIATIVEVSALSVQTMSFGVNMINNCWRYSTAEDWM